MNRRLLAFAAVVLAVTLPTGTPGFDTARTDRSVSVSAASDDNAFLGVRGHDPDLETGVHRPVDLFTLRNNLPDGAVIESVDGRVETVGTTGGGPSVDVRSVAYPGSIPSGEREPVTATVVCGGTPPGESVGRVALTLEAVTANDTRIELTRSVTVTCHGTPPTPAN